MGDKHRGATAEDFSVRPTVNGVGVALQGEGTSNPWISSLQSTDITVPANSSMIVVGDYEIASGNFLELAVGANLEIS